MTDRIKGKHSRHEVEDSSKCPYENHIWRTLVCEGVAGEGRDIVECYICGKQANIRCNFDEEYS